MAAETAVKLLISYNQALRHVPVAGDRRWWILGCVALRREERTDPVWHVEVLWRRMVLLGGGIVVAGYLALASAGWAWWARNPHNQVRWADVALAPVRWDRLTRLRGDTAIATALDQLKQRDYAGAYYGLRLGLVRSPANVSARLALMRLLAYQDPAQALTLAEEGLDVAPDSRELLHAVFGLYGAQHAAARAIQQAEQLMAPNHEPPVSRANRFHVGAVRFGLLLDQGRLSEAERAHAELEPLALAEADRREWRRLGIALFLKRGQIAEARTWRHDHFPSPGDADTLRLDAEIALAAGDEEGLSLALRRLHDATSEGVVSHLYALECWHRAKLPARLEAAEREYAALFAANDAAMQAFAALEVNFDRPEAVESAARAAAANGRSDFAYRVHLTEISLRRGHYDEAFRRLQEWEPLVATLKPEQRFYPLFLGRLVRCCVVGGDLQTGLLLHALEEGRGQAQPSSYRLAEEVLERSGNLAAAAGVTAAGLRLYSYCDPLLAAGDRLKGGTPELSTPTTDTVRTVIPATAQETVRAVDAALGGGELVKARALLRQARAQPADWAGGLDSELALREVMLALRSEDPIAAQAVVRGYLDQHRSERDVLRLVDLAAGEVARHSSANAQLLHDAVATQPDLSPVVRQALAALGLSDELAEAAADPAAALAALDRALGDRDFARADRVLRYLRQKQPGWLGGSAAEIAVREVPLRLALDQQPLAIEAFKSLVVRAGAPRSAAFKLVRTLLAQGELSSAALLAREAVRLLPDDPAAAHLLKEVQTPRGG